MTIANVTYTEASDGPASTSESYAPTMGFRWKRRKKGDPVLQQAQRGLTTGKIVWVDVPTVD